MMPGLIAKGSVYLRIVSWSYLLQSVSQIYLCIMKNSGRAMKSTVFSFVSMAMNIFLNAILIFGLFGAPAYGIAGGCRRDRDIADGRAPARAGGEPEERYDPASSVRHVFP
jgi:hypothetical protein